MDAKLSTLWRIIEDQRSKIDDLRANHETLCQVFESLRGGSEGRKTPDPVPVLGVAGVRSGLSYMDETRVAGIRSAPRSIDLRPDRQAAWHAQAAERPGGVRSRPSSMDKQTGAKQTGAASSSEMTSGGGDYPKSAERIFLQSLNSRLLRIVRSAFDIGYSLGDLEVMNDSDWARLGIGFQEQESIQRKLQDCRAGVVDGNYTDGDANQSPQKEEVIFREEVIIKEPGDARVRSTSPQQSILKSPAPLQSRPVMYGKHVPQFYTFDQLDAMPKDFVIARLRDIRDFLGQKDTVRVPAQREKALLRVLELQAEYTGGKASDFGAPVPGYAQVRSASPTRGLLV